MILKAPTLAMGAVPCCTHVVNFGAVSTIFERNNVLMGSGVDELLLCSCVDGKPAAVGPTTPRIWVKGERENGREDVDAEVKSPG